MVSFSNGVNCSLGFKRALNEIKKNTTSKSSAAMQWIYGALRSLLRGDVRGARAERSGRKPRLGVELLEDRVVPAGDFRDVIGLDAVDAAYSYRGTGYTVAILDTGIDYRNADLGGGFGAGKRVVAGWDFVNNDADPMDDHGHGTHLAGIIGSSNANAKGIASNVQFVALKVLNSTNSGTWANIEAGLQWVIKNQAKYNIVGVNLSLGSGNYVSNPYSMLESSFTQLKNLGVFTAAAAGNRFYTFNSAQGVGYPSISPNVVSVGATWAGDFGAATFSTGAADYSSGVDRIVSFSQRSSELSIVAPGSWITSIGLNNTTKTMGGTSQATAVITGSAVLIHEALDQTGKAAQANQANILQIMKSTGVTVIDGDDENDNVANTGLTFKRVNLKAALDSISKPNNAPTFAAVADQTIAAGQTLAISLVASDVDGDPVKFTARLVYLPAQAYALDGQYQFNSSGNYYTNSTGGSEKWIYSNARAAWYVILPSGDLRRWAGTLTQTLDPSNLVSTLDASYYADPTKLWKAPVASAPASVDVTGTTLTLRAASNWVGTYQVEVSATDGRYVVKRTFNVNQTNANTPPVLTAPVNQTISHSKRSLSLSLTATDADKDVLTYSAQVLPNNGQAAPITVLVQGNQLTLNPALTAVGTYTVQVSASDGKSSVTRTFTVTINNSAPVLAGFADQSFSHGIDKTISLSATDGDGDLIAYSARVLPINGQAAPINATITGSLLTLHPTQATIGTYTVEVTASDGAATTTRTFAITLTNEPPTLGTIPTQTLATGKTSLTLTLPATDTDGDALKYTASVQAPSSLAYQLNQQYAFVPANATYYLNLKGYQEKWLIGKGNIWYAIMPDGRLYRWSRTMAETLTPLNLVATLDASFYTEPRLLTEAKAATATGLTATLAGNQLTIQRPAALIGIFYVDVTVFDGWTTIKRTIQVVLN